MFGQPVDLPVVGDHLVLELGGSDEPAFARILDQRILFGSPAERIVVQVLVLKEQRPLGPKLAADITIGLLDPTALGTRASRR